MRRFFKLQSEKGFTLIELLIVIAIIGILSAFLTTNYITVRQRARDAQRKADLRQVQAALEQYRADQQAYPASGINNFYLGSAACPTPGPFNFTVSGTTYTYMTAVPCDPSGTGYYEGGNYYYRSNSSNTTYVLVACLENTNDTGPNTIADPSGLINYQSDSSFSTACSGRFYYLYNP